MLHNENVTSNIVLNVTNVTILLLYMFLYFQSEFKNYEEKREIENSHKSGHIKYK